MSDNDLRLDYSVTKVPTWSRNDKGYGKMLDEFIGSGKSVAKVSASDLKAAGKMASAMYYHAKRYGMAIKIIRRGCDVYLAKAEAAGEP